MISEPGAEAKESANHVGEPERPLALLQIESLGRSAGYDHRYLALAFGIILWSVDSSMVS
ncbi:hypothetical protein N9B17_01205 [Rhodopirellula sp.]|nr:hypothetical protein [Rhodopirellula sp.]